MDGYFEHDQSVIELAYRLVREYDQHEAEQDTWERGKRDENNNNDLE